MEVEEGDDTDSRQDKPSNEFKFIFSLEKICIKNSIVEILWYSARNIQILKFAQKIFNPRI